MTKSQFSKVNAFVPHQVHQREIINLGSIDPNENFSECDQIQQAEKYTDGHDVMRTNISSTQDITIMRFSDRDRYLCTEGANMNLLCITDIEEN